MSAPHTRWPRIGSGQRRLLLTIAKRKDGVSDSELQALGLFVDPRQTAKTLLSLLAHGLLCYEPKLHVWCITRHGNDLLDHLCAPPKPYQGVVTPPRTIRISDEHYMGEDLRPQQARPGGNTHTTIPSLIGGLRVLRRAE
jgi:hypothetical protein